MKNPIPIAALIILWALGWGLVPSAYPETGTVKTFGQEAEDEILRHSVNGDRLGLKKTFVDLSVEPPREFTLEKEAPDILKNIGGEEKERLLGIYSMIWNYESGTAYWIVEKMRKVSSDSHGKIRHFGFANYLKDNLGYMEDALDYAVELFLNKKEVEEGAVRNLALKSQKRLQEAGDAKGAPVIGMNPILYMDEKCVAAKGKIILFKVRDNLKLLGSSHPPASYSALIRSAYSPEEYRDYIREFTGLNRAYLDAVNGSKASLPWEKKWAWPVVGVGVWRETGNAHEFILKLYDFLYGNIYGTEKK